MRKTFLVALQQIKRIAFHWSFVVVVLYPPLVTLILGAYFGFVVWAAGLKSGEESLPAPGVIITNNVPFDKPVGLVDLAHLVVAVPDDLTGKKLLSFADEAAARAAVRSGAIAGYYLVSQDFLASGVVSYFSLDNVQFIETDAAVERLLILNLASGDGEAVARRVAAPIAFDERKLTLPGGPPPAPETYTGAEVGLGVAIAAFVYFTIGSVCGMFLNQMAHERQGRVLEVVLGAMTPTQLLTGKFVGILVVGLIETGAWFFWVRVLSFAGAQLAGFSNGAFGLSGMAAATSVDAASGAGLITFLLSGLVFIGGYVAYVATAAAFGAVVQETRQASRINFMLVMVAMSPTIWLISVLADRGGPLAVILSLIPLTAPIILTLRIFVSEVPLWQVMLSVILSLGWTVGMLWLSGRLFQARVLFSNEPAWSIGRVLGWPKERAET